MGHPDGMEARLVLARGYEMAWVRFSALRGKGLWRKLLLPFNLLSAFWQARREIRRIRPDVVLVVRMGGYISFPGGLMAVQLGCPLVIHEQNSVAGLANRVLARLATRIVCGFPNALPRGEWVGNPVRPEIAQMGSLPAERFANRVATAAPAGARRQPWCRGDQRHRAQAEPAKVEERWRGAPGRRKTPRHAARELCRGRCRCPCVAFIDDSQPMNGPTW